ncbi:SRPBCC family protein [Paraburkholderia dinghuensis]|uniref:SRPBCC domain-containing protein n=1 Tax=Paraburkholderia dinghuensis TaxID=2305225 RepID=A0A3N6MR27_9BURK|nr:SRPBCC domain-containing protein [Paraburkholderia dinghuensis]RQH00161.1 SRPBCC domain-containing protein [Paraburkholderia dinghuensis]
MSANPDAGFASSPSLTLRRRLNASPAKVYAAWTEPSQLMQWMHPFDTTCIHAEADVRVGGHFRVIMRAPDGEDHDVSGTYLEVVPDARLVFTWVWRSTPERESLVTVMLRADGNATELTLKHERFFDEAARDAHEGGWSSSLDNLVEQFRHS